MCSGSQAEIASRQRKGGEGDCERLTGSGGEMRDVTWKRYRARRSVRGEGGEETGEQRPRDLMLRCEGGARSPCEVKRVMRPYLNRLSSQCAGSTLLILGTPGCLRVGQKDSAARGAPD